MSTCIEGKAHQFEERREWKLAIPQAEFTRLTKSVKEEYIAEITRACIWSCYVHDICIKCGEVITNTGMRVIDEQLTKQSIERAVKVQ